GVSRQHRPTNRGRERERETEIERDTHKHTAVGISEEGGVVRRCSPEPPVSAATGGISVHTWGHWTSDSEYLLGVEAIAITPRHHCCRNILTTNQIRLAWSRGICAGCPLALDAKRETSAAERIRSILHPSVRVVL
ncbi:unnamed protein product, partial [Ectocarpus fasciculatus]